jgi:hypothetical protein
MPDRIKPPNPTELATALNEVLSICGVARRYCVSQGTATKWLHNCGLDPVLNSPEHRRILKKRMEESAKNGTRKRIDRDLERRLTDEGDRKLVARAIVDESYLQYGHKKCLAWERYVLTLTLVMYDSPPVAQIARLIGVPLEMFFRKTKSGFMVPCWRAMARGYRAFRVLQLTRPYMVGQKAFQTDIALRVGAEFDGVDFIGETGVPKEDAGRPWNRGKRGAGTQASRRLTDISST